MVKWKYPKDIIWNGENEKSRERERVVVVVWNGLVMFGAEWLKCTSEKKWVDSNWWNKKGRWRPKLTLVEVVIYDMSIKEIT